MKSNYFTSLKEINREEPKSFSSFLFLVTLAHETHPDVLPQFAGKNWPLDDVNNCIGTTTTNNNNNG